MLVPRPRLVAPVPTRPLLLLLLTALLLLTVLPIAQVRASAPLAPLPHNAPVAQPTPQVKAVAVGWAHACVVMSTGAVRCWGNNESGQTAVPADLGPVSQVSTGFSHTCAVTTAGAVRCWGGSSETNIPADLGPVSQVSAGFRYTCAVTTATMLRCWGRTAGTIVPADLGPVNQVSVGLTIAAEGGTACAVTTAGTVRCWSDPSSRDIVNFHMPKDLGPISQVSTGNDNACAMGTGGSLRCWGDGASAVPADLGPISQVNVGFDISGDVTCVVTTARSLRCWGGVNNHLPADLGPVSQVSKGEYGTCAVTTAGVLRCWNSDGEIQLDPAVAGGGATSGNGTTTLATGLVYSAGGQQYQVDANRSTAIGAAPPTGSILGPGNTRLWIEMTDTPGDRQPFQIFQANRDGSNQQVLLNNSTFYQQFPEYVSLYHQYESKIPPTLVLSADKTQVFFIACQQGMGESAFCAALQLDLASHTLSQLKKMEFKSSPAWLHPDGQRAVDSWDLNCSGGLRRVDVEQKPLSGMPISAVWLSDMSFVYSRYICKGVWTEGNITPQYDIILANADGSDNRVLVPGKVASAMALAPDQQTLAFITSDPGKLQSGEVALWVVNLDGTGLHKVMDLPKDAADLRWDEASVGAGTGPGQATPPPPPAPTTGEIAYVQNGNIYLLDLASRKTTPLVTDGTVGSPDEWRGGIQLTWSPDGRRLAYASNRAGNYDIYTLDMASRKSERISTDPLDEYLPSFAPDGMLFFVRITKAHVHNNVVGEWKLIRVTTSGLQTVVTTDTYVVDKIDALSHDEMLIITSGDMGWGSLSTGKKDVIWNNDNYNCAWPGGGQSTFDAAWSHDGTTLAVIAADCPKGDTSGNWRTAIFLTDAANPNAEPRRLLSDQYGFSTLDWSPDDTWLVYEGGINKEVGLWLVSAKGGTPQRIADTGTRPAWRPTVTGGDQAQATVVPTTSAQPTAPIQPTAPTASGDAASDAEPPAVTITVAKQGGLWLATITAEDTGSGVKRVLYATDDQHYQVYTAPFEVNPNEVPTLYAFADDNVANRSGVVTYTLIRDEPWGWPSYGLLALGALVLAGGAFVSSRRTTPPAQRRWLVLAVIAGGAALVILAAFVVFPGLVGPQMRPTVPAAAPTPASAVTAPAGAAPPALATNQPTVTTATAPAGAAPPALPTNQPTATSALAPTVTLAAVFVPSPMTEPSATSVRTLPTAQAAQVPTLAPTVTLVATTRPASSPMASMQSCSLTLAGGFGIIWRSSAAMQQRIGCPTQAERGGQIAEQPYERGSMFYYDPLRLIYALAGGERGTWRVYEQDRLMSQPTPTPATSPPGLITPVHGFGLVWGTQAWVRNTVGWGTRNEDGPLDGAAQMFEHGTMLFSPVGLGRGKMLYVLYDDGTFERYDDPNR